MGYFGGITGIVRGISGADDKDKQKAVDRAVEEARRVAQARAEIEAQKEKEDRMLKDAELVDALTTRGVNEGLDELTAASKARAQVAAIKTSSVLANSALSDKTLKTTPSLTDAEIEQNRLAREQATSSRGTLPLKEGSERSGYEAESAGNRFNKQVNLQRDPNATASAFNAGQNASYANSTLRNAVDSAKLPFAPEAAVAGEKALGARSALEEAQASSRLPNVPLETSALASDANAAIAKNAATTMTFNLKKPEDYARDAELHKVTTEQELGVKKFLLQHPELDPSRQIYHPNWQQQMMGGFGAQIPTSALGNGTGFIAPAPGTTNGAPVGRKLGQPVR